MVLIRNLIIVLSLLVITSLQAQTQNGKATFYSKRSTGSRTASGERLHHDSLTCAHRTYPFGTLLKVTNLDNNKSVVVKVIDRGPFSRGRIIDLSWRAAKELDILSKGVSMVRVERYNESMLFRPAEGANLPEIDFEMTEAGNGLSEGWAPRVEKGDILETEVKKKSAVKSGTHSKSAGKQQKEHHAVEKNGNGSSWSNVFSTIKKKTGEIF